MKYYVYVMECQSDGKKPFKIGVSADPEKRICELQVGCPWPIKLLMKLECGSRTAAYNLESHLHKRLRKHRMQGEWFSPGKVKLKDIFESSPMYSGVAFKSEDVSHKEIRGSKIETKNINDHMEMVLDSRIDAWFTK